MNDAISAILRIIAIAALLLSFVLFLGLMTEPGGERWALLVILLGGVNALLLYAFGVLLQVALSADAHLKKISSELEQIRKAGRFL